VACALIVWALHPMEQTALDPQLVDGLRETMGVMAGIVVFAAGAVTLSSWRLDGDSGAAYVGSALLVLGGLGYPLSQVDKLLDVSAQPVPSSVTRLLVTAGTCLLFGLAATRGSSSTVRVRELLAMVSAAVVAVCTLLWLNLYAFGTVSRVTPDERVVIESVTALILMVAWGTHLSGVRQRTSSAWTQALAPLLPVLAAVATLRAVAAAGVTSAGLVAAALLLTGAIWALVRSSTVFRSRVVASTERIDAALAALTRLEQLVTTHRRERRELAHEATNSTAAVRLTLMSLMRSRTDSDAARELTEAAQAELRELESRIRPGRDRAPECDLGAVVSELSQRRAAVGLGTVSMCGRGRVAAEAADVAAALRLLLAVVTPVPGQGPAVSVQEREEQVRLRITGWLPDDDRSRGEVALAESLLSPWRGEVEVTTHFRPSVSISLPAPEPAAPTGAGACDWDLSRLIAEKV
jgi:hypothetical protein